MELVEFGLVTMRSKTQIQIRPSSSDKKDLWIRRNLFEQRNDRCLRDVTLGELDYSDCAVLKR